MLRLSKMADYGIVLLAQFASATAPQSLSAADLAQSTQLPLPTVAKCLKSLSKARILESHRGVHGGYRLARPPEQISIAEAIRALDGPIALTMCCETSESSALRRCEYEDCCRLKINWRRINAALEAALESVRLSDMINQSARLSLQETWEDSVNASPLSTTHDPFSLG